jgi:bacteriocin-like protein
MEEFTLLSKEEMNQIDGGSFVGWLIGSAGYLLERAANTIASHPVGGSRNYQI